MIKSNQGEVEIVGKTADVCADFGVLMLGMFEAVGEENMLRITKKVLEDKMKEYKKNTKKIIDIDGFSENDKKKDKK